MQAQSRYIQLANGGRARVDADDYEKLNKHRWSRSTNGYAYRQGWTGSQRDSANHWTIWMHRVVNGTPDGKLTDHENFNKLDNRKRNLRTATKSRDSSHRHKNRKRNVTSRFKGVSLHPSTKLWRARIKDGDFQRTTYHHSQREAALDYNRMAKERFAEFAVLNVL